ncbi:MAG: hypothetical protein NTW48_08285 [Chloroflexi bacterium]|nr:hypothetical protein [Chloroflexota bacterium]
MRKLTWLLPVISILALVLAATTSVSAAANFEIENPTISPNPAKEGDIITISCVVKNTGSENGTYTLELKITGTLTGTQFTDTQEVTLDAGNSQTVTFEVEAGPPDDYVVELGDSSDYFTVTGQTSFWGIFPKGIWIAIVAIIVVLLVLIILLTVMPSRKKQPGAAIKGKKDRQGLPSMQAAMPIPTPIPGPGPTSPQSGYPTAMPTQTPGAFPAPGQFPAPGLMAAPYSQYAGRPIFSVSNLTITPNQVKSGEPITISAIVFNNGSEAGTYSVVLRINGMVENIIDLTLSPGASQSTTFTVIKDAGDDYYAEVDGLGGAFTVIPLVPANFSVSNLVIAPERVKQGGKVTISAIVTNNGELAGNYSMVLKLKGAVESTEEISLGPGENQKVAFGITKNTPGFYNVEVENLTGRFVVEMEWQG